MTFIDAIIVAVILLSVAWIIKILIKPLPEWNGLHGEKYLEWKKKQHEKN